MNIDLEKNTEAVKEIGLDEIREEDVFIASYPRSGNSWTRFMIAKMLNPEKVINLCNIEDHAQDLHTSQKIVNSIKEGRRFIKTHYPRFELYPKMIYLYRDGRDVMVSFYHYLYPNFWGRPRFHRFLHQKNDDPFIGSWQNHVTTAFDFAERFPERILLIRYEDLLQDTIQCVKLMAEFCELSATDQEIKTAVNFCKFENLQKVERTYGYLEKQKLGFRFFRFGRQNQWRKVFSKKDIKFFESIAGRTLKRLNYE